MNSECCFNESQYPVVFTGAGMSTEAGLPDFCSPSSGLWNKFNSKELASIEAMKCNISAFMDFIDFASKVYDM